jgi:two-component system, sensor histidine kinase and response regulator
MVTASSSKAILSSCLEAGADDFISKPVDKVELRARIKSMLRLKKQFDAIESSTKL